VLTPEFTDLPGDRGAFLPHSIRTSSISSIRVRDA
jgi:hypothetical protein